MACTLLFLLCPITMTTTACAEHPPHARADVEMPSREECLSAASEFLDMLGGVAARRRGFNVLLLCAPAGMPA